MTQRTSAARRDAFHPSSPDNAYLLGHSSAERHRLDEQGANLRPITQRLLRDMGLSAGMRVLDVGCGTGDVSFLAADLVGPTGVVVGVDRSPDALADARLRGRTSPNVEFIQGDIADFHSTDRFDAVVGRLVLIHQTAPSAVLKHLAGLVRPGGLIGFAEPVMLPQLAWPARPLYTRCITWCVAALESAGLTPNTGLHLYSMFRQAGLPDPRQRFEGAITAGVDVEHCRWLADTVRTLLPLMERAGITTAAEADPESLVERLAAEAAASSGSACGFALIGAWTNL